ncbi:MAG: family 20 glycosylhydrolase [Specibacter sp.]
MGLQTVPAVQHWNDDGAPAWVPTPGIRVVPAARDALLLGEPAASLAKELGARLLDTGAPAKPGDIELRLEPLDGLNLTPAQSAEAYRLTAGAVLVITAPTPAGLYYGTRTLLQWLRSGGPVRGTVTDWPRYAQRGVMVDVGRKYFSPQWLVRLIENMGWLKLNHLHLHLNDNVGVGLECTSHPEIVSKQHLSYADLDAILALAAAHHVTVVPEFDTPSHAGAILAHHPELAITDRHGTVENDKLNLADPAARALVADVVLEWAHHFPGPFFHVGGDEFFAAPWEPADHQHPLRYPGLARYAEAQIGAPATPLDGYVHYCNELNALLKSQGKRMRLWNDHVHPGAGVALDRDVDVEVWIRWNASQPSALDLHNAGYTLVNRNGDHLYFVLSSDSVPAVSGRKSAQGVYELWHPHRFMGAAGGAADLDLDPSVPVAGAVMSIWCDHPPAMTQDQVAAQIAPWLRSLAQQVWGSPKQAPSYPEFSALCAAIGDAPVIERVEIQRPGC